MKLESPKERISRLAFGYLHARAIYTAAELGIADLLKGRTGLSSDEIALRLKSDPRAVFRLLRFLVSHGVFTQDSEGRFCLNPEAEYLTEDHPQSIRHALLVDEEPRWNALGAMKRAVMTGKPSFDQLYGTSYYEYLSERADSTVRFNAHMTAITREEDKILAPHLFFDGVKTVADIGGGTGQFLNEVLSCFPGLNGVLFELESVVSCRELLEIDHPEERWAVQEGDFFKSPLPTVDVYLLKRVLHNWSDEDSVAILKNVRSAMSPRSRLCIIEAIVPEGTGAHISKDIDLFLMPLFAGGERTEKEFTSLCSAAGLTLRRIVPTASHLSIIEVTL